MRYSTINRFFFQVNSTPNKLECDSFSDYERKRCTLSPIKKGNIATRESKVNLSHAFEKESRPGAGHVSSKVDPITLENHPVQHPVKWSVKGLDLKLGDRSLLTNPLGYVVN